MGLLPFLSQQMHQRGRRRRALGAAAVAAARMRRCGKQRVVVGTVLLLNLYVDTKETRFYVYVLIDIF
jgi:hypothetical protein